MAVLHCTCCVFWHSISDCLTPSANITKQWRQNSELCCTPLSALLPTFIQHFIPPAGFNFSCERFLVRCKFLLKVRLQMEGRRLWWKRWKNKKKDKLSHVFHVFATEKHIWCPSYKYVWSQPPVFLPTSLVRSEQLTVIITEKEKTWNSKHFNGI